MMVKKTEYYITRTFEHIHRVQNNALKIVLSGKFDDIVSDLMFNVACHDRSKFNDIQFQAYADFTWAKKNGEELSPEQQKAFDRAWEDHQIQENHHPNSISGTRYICDTPEAIEIACDLQAMAQEFGYKSGRGYFNKVWKKKNCQYFCDDYKWFNAVAIINECFDIFEEEEKS